MNDKDLYHKLYKAYQTDPEWIKLDKSARRWRKALYVVVTITTVAFLLTLVAKVLIAL